MDSMLYSKVLRLSMTAKNHWNRLYAAFSLSQKSDASFAFERVKLPFAAFFCVNPLENRLNALYWWHCILLLIWPFSVCRFGWIASEIRENALDELCMSMVACYKSYCAGKLCKYFPLQFSFSCEMLSTVNENMSSDSTQSNDDDLRWVAMAFCVRKKMKIS